MSQTQIKLDCKSKRMVNPQIFLFGALGLAGLGRKVYTMLGSNSIASHTVAALSGAMAMAIVAEGGYNPMPLLQAGAKILIKGGEEAAKALGLPEDPKELEEIKK